MAAKTKGRRARKPRRDTYADVTNRIVEMLEQGVRPWEQSKLWAAGQGSRPLRHHGVPYRGVNVLLLWFESMRQGHNSPRWMTYKQAQKLGGQVRKGESGTQVVFSQRFEKKEKDENGEERIKSFNALRTYVVFNADQIDGLAEKYYAKPPKSSLNEEERDAALDTFFDRTGAVIGHGGGSAYYSPPEDRIQMPNYEAFHSKEAYYGTLAHELVHWTGHKSRTGRKQGGWRAGFEQYAFEELIAEIGAAYLCSDLGVEVVVREDHASYVKHYVDVLKDDKGAIFRAARAAEVALEFIHDLVPGYVASLDATAEEEATTGIERPERSRDDGSPAEAAAERDAGASGVALAM